MAYEDYQPQIFGSDLPPLPQLGGSIPKHVLDALAIFGYPVNALAGLVQGLTSENLDESALSNTYQGATGKRSFHFGDIMGIPRPDDNAPWSEYLPQLVAHELPQFMLDPLNVAFAPAKAAGLFPRIAKALQPITRVADEQSMIGKVAELAGVPRAVNYLAGTALAKLGMRRAPESIPGAKGFEETVDRIKYEHNMAPVLEEWLPDSVALEKALKDYPGVTKMDVYDAAERVGSRPDLQPLVDIVKPWQKRARQAYEEKQAVRSAVGRESYPALEEPGVYDHMIHMEIPQPGKGMARRGGDLGNPNAYNEPGRTIWRWEDTPEPGGKVITIGKVTDPRSGLVKIPTSGEPEVWYVGKDNIVKGRAGTRVKQFAESDPNRQGLQWTDPDTGKVVALGEAGTARSGVAVVRKWTGQVDQAGNRVYETEHWLVGPDNVYKGRIRALPPSPGHEFIDEAGKVLTTGELGKNATGVAEIKSSEGTKRLFVGENIKKGNEVATWPEGGRFEFIDTNGQVVRTGKIGKDGIVKIGNEYLDIHTASERYARSHRPLTDLTAEITPKFVPFDAAIPVKARPLPVDALPGTEVKARALPIQEPGIPVKGTPQEPVMPGFRVYPKPASIKEAQAITPNRKMLDDPMAALLLEITHHKEQTKYIKMVEAGLESKLVQPGLTPIKDMRPINVKGFEDLQAHPAIANRLENMGKSLFDPESGAGSIAQLLDNVVNSRVGQAGQGLTGYWKKFILAHPGWMAGNTFSNWPQMAMETNPLRIPDRTAHAIKIWKEGGPRYEEWLNRNLFNTGQYGESPVSQQVAERLGIAMGKEPGMLGKAGQIVDKTLLNPIFKAGGWIENIDKVAVAEDWLAKNAPKLAEMAPAEQIKMLDRAARVAHDTLGNYSRANMTPTEANLAALPIPFYGWLSHVARSTWYNATRQPQKLNRLGMTLDTAFEPLSAEDKRVADPWLREQAPVRKFLGMPFGTSSTGLPNIAMLGRYLPQGNLEQFLKRPTDAVLSWINPFIKAPAELGANKSAFKGRDIDKLAGGFPYNLINPVLDMVKKGGAPYEMATNKLFGQSIPAGWDYLIGQSPWGRHLKETDVLGEGLGLWKDPNREPSSPWEAGAFTLSGGKFYPFDRTRYEKNRKYEATKEEQAIKSNLNYARKRGDTTNMDFYQKKLEQLRSRRAGDVEN